MRRMVAKGWRCEEVQGGGRGGWGQGGIIPGGWRRHSRWRWCLKRMMEADEEDGGARRRGVWRYKKAGEEDEAKTAPAGSSEVAYKDVGGV